LLRELDLPAKPLDDGWIVQLGEAEVGLLTVPREGVIAGMLPLPGVTEAEGLAEFLAFNLEQHLAYYAAAAEPPGLDARLRILAEPFEREAVLQGLEAMCDVAEGLLGNDQRAVRDQLRAARRPVEPDEARRRAHRALETGLSDLAIEGVRRDDDSWELSTSRGPLSAVLDAAGETWMFTHALEYTDGLEDPVILRWLLVCSAGLASRLGFRRGSDELFSAFVLATAGMNTWRLAYVLEDVLRLSDQYDHETREYERRQRR
jgi:hypothetical protein